MVVCFDRDQQFPGACATSRPPDYEEGVPVRIRVESSLPATAYMSVRCMGGCPTGDPSATNVYWARYVSAGLTFPNDFVDPGPNNDGGNAVLDRAARYNSTWKATYHLPAPIERDFNVWLYDAWFDNNYTVRPGAPHHIRASGFEPGGEVTYRWERRDPNSGRYFPFFSTTARASPAGNPSVPAGVVEKDFAFPKNESLRIQGCGGQVYDCYRIIIEGAGKKPELVNVQVGLAKIERSLDTTPRQAPSSRPTFQRTMNVTAEVDLYYPHGRLRTGPKFSPEDAPLSVRHGGHALRVAVEKFYNVNQSSWLVDEVPLRFDLPSLVWRTQWTVPKSEIIDSSATYRLRLIDQRDAYGNLIVNDTLLNFTIENADLKPVLIESFRDLERTELGVMRVAVLYHNGEPFTPADAPAGNSSPLSGCFVHLATPPPDPAPPVQAQSNSCPVQTNVERVWGTYYDGAWNFSVRYPRGYENLDSHRFIMENQTKDRWNNNIWHVASPAFRVDVAKPNVEFSTVERGRDTDVIERGNRVFVSATITYHDGTPYNHQVRVMPNSSAAQQLNGTLVRRGPGTASDPYGPIASEEPFNLQETDSTAGRWSGYLQLTDDDTYTPVGIWSWRYDITDNLSVPNRNMTSFDREVVSSTIQLCPTFQPSSTVPTGGTLKFRFRLFYSDCDVGREVPIGAVESHLTARVFPYDPNTKRPVGASVSNAIVPSFSRGGTEDWGLEYTVPNNLFGGSYLFVVSGVDSFGNKLVPNAFSKSFTTFTEVRVRGVITEPADEVLRGDSATVVFDSREGDTGVDPSRPLPRIQLERFDTSSTDCQRALAEGGCWVRERGDVRVPDPTLTDHMGVFPVGVDTPVGLYRFSLQGRDRDFHIITGVSGNFTVNPTQVTRALLSTTPEAIVKGVPFSFYVESLAGDSIRERIMFLNGRVVSLPLPQMAHEPGRLNLTWAIPFEAPTGNYTIRLNGLDVNGNVITVLTPPIEAQAASLEGRVIGNPPKTVQRGETSRLQFGVGYPDGSFYAATDEPRVFVVSATGVSFPAGIRREGLGFAASWTPTGSSPIGEYYFEVSPQATGGTGNLFPPLRSNVFRVVPGTIQRPAIDDMTAELERLKEAGFSAPYDQDDKFVGFELVYYGPSLSTAVDLTTPLVEVTRTPLTHTIDGAAGKYVTKIVTDYETRTGTFRIVMTGEDSYGNRIVAQSRPFVIRPTTISVIWQTVPSDKEFGEGKTTTLTFDARYALGALMTDALGRPSATVLWNGKPVKQSTQIEFVKGHWAVSWTAPDILPPGQYEFLVGGFDSVGNPIATGRSTPYLVSQGSLIDSAKKVPGPSPLVGVGVLALVALALAARRRA